MMHELSLLQLSDGLQKRQFSSVELTQYFLKRIDSFNTINAFTHINETHAIQQAQLADEKIRAGQSNKLTGIPAAHKDIFCTQQNPTTCASKMLAHYTPPFNASFIDKLMQQYSVILGKTNMDEFGMGSTTENSYFGATKNPWNYQHCAGGSSGGSAAAVAARLAPWASGSDTGGSIRQPASFCGISGIKPTYGLISRYGMIAFASSLEQAGPMAKSVEDLSVALQNMAGFDEKDSTSVNTEIPDYVKEIKKPIKSIKIGIPEDLIQAHTDTDIQQSLKKALTSLEDAQIEIVPISFDMHSFWVPCYYIIACAEASSNLARYDGVRYGYRTPSADDFEHLIAKTRSEGFGIEVKRRIVTGAYVLSSEHIESYYLRAQKVRRLIRDEFLKLFKSVDMLITPCAPHTAPQLNAKITDPTQRYLEDTFTTGPNLGGFPALSIPIGFDKTGLPIGMQCIGNHFQETMLLQLGHHYQKMTDWHKKTPTMVQ